MRLLAWMNDSPRKLLVALGIATCAAAIAVGSGANFNSSTSNAGGLIKSGTIKQTNSKNGQAILDVTDLAPGSTRNGTLDIKNSGDLDGTFSLTKSGLVDTPASPPFSGKLNLKVDDLGDPDCTSSCPATATKYDGTVGAMGAINLGVFHPAQTHRYRFTVTFPDGGPGGADNAYNNAHTSVTYNWESTS
jgi:hypothetical protein